MGTRKELKMESVTRTYSAEHCNEFGIGESRLGADSIMQVRSSSVERARESPPLHSASASQSNLCKAYLAGVSRLADWKYLLAGP